MAKRKLMVISILFFLFISQFSLIALAQESGDDDEINYDEAVKWQSIQIDHTNLGVKLRKNYGVLKDYTGTGTIDVGGVKLLTQGKGGIKTGKVGETIDTEKGKAFMHYRGVFEFSVNVYTLAGIEDVYPDINRDRTKKIKYFHLNKYKSVDIWNLARDECAGTGLNGLDPIKAYAYYGDIKLGSLKSNEFSGDYGITVFENSVYDKFEGLYHLGNDIYLQNPNLKKIVSKVYLANSESKRIADYVNEYSSYDEVFGSVKTDSFKEKPKLGSGSKKNDIENLIKSYSAGRVIAKPTTAQTTQQGVFDAGSPGSDIANPSDSSSFSFSRKVKIRPKVDVEKDDIQWNYLKCFWDYEDVIGSKAVAEVCDFRTKTAKNPRVKGVRVYNRLIRHTWNVIIDYLIESDIQVDKKVGGLDLEDPNVGLSNTTFDTSFTGDKNVTVDSTQRQGPLSEFLDDLMAYSDLFYMIMIGVVVAIVGLVILMIYSKRQKAKSMETLIKMATGRAGGYQPIYPPPPSYQTAQQPPPSYYPYQPYYYGPQEPKRKGRKRRGSKGNGNGNDNGSGKRILD